MIMKMNILLTKEPFFKKNQTKEPKSIKNTVLSCDMPGSLA